MSSHPPKTIYAHSYTQVPLDRNVESVKSRFDRRVIDGFFKYGTNTERTDLSTLEWIQHAQDEAMDFVIYLERLKQEIKDVQ